MMNRIPVVDIFAGPGGLGEGFSTYTEGGEPVFKIRLSIEKDIYAHSTLRLRSFFKRFRPKAVPEEYYEHLRGRITLDELFERYQNEAESVHNEIWKAELGKVGPEAVNRRIKKARGNASDWILIGGPPCQAYSTVGRSRNKGIKNYSAEKDKRHFLYREYLRIIAHHWPALFVMENVRGILSSRVNGNSIFEDILKDLENPARIFNGKAPEKQFKYRIFSLAKVPDYFNREGWPRYKRMQDFTIKCENFGIPQARHRVILLGIREDISVQDSPALKQSPGPPVEAVIGDLPALRSGFSNGVDNTGRWLEWIKKISHEKWMKELRESTEFCGVYRQIISELDRLGPPDYGRGSEFIPCRTDRGGALADWYTDQRLGGICNSTTRGHMDRDLYRYFYAACYARKTGHTPVLPEFPHDLLPQHKNAKRAGRNGNFTDRFRVQAASRPATTIMSHISKDGHYYIHYDPLQCRSLTVREAARIQTFPDNYFFSGPRTQQYVQVGNAVPPLLAHEIARIVFRILTQTKQDF